MMRSQWWQYLLPALASLALASVGAAAERPTAKSISATIDARLAANRSVAMPPIEPAPLADDAEFLRRVSLDLLGRIPRVPEVRDFLEDSSPDKRRRLVDRLLADPAHVRHFTHIWRATLFSQATAPDLRVLNKHLESWLEPRVRSNLAYDRLVREILTTPLSGQFASAAVGKEPPPLAFFQANELKPENLASAASRVFLGVNLECAQCHHHPFAPWKQEQFWQFAGFFAGVGRLLPSNAMAAAPEMTDRRELSIPGTDRVVSARFLDGAEPHWSAGHSPRETLAEWITAPGNPYFARATVNRLWAQFFGRGLIDPLDALGSGTKDAHSALLDELGRQFAASGFDVELFVRGIAGSDAYQRTSQLTDPSQRDVAKFARMPVRGLSPEQLCDSLALAIGGGEEHRDQLLAAFASLDRPTETQTSILQALLMMNGKLTGLATSSDSGGTLAAVVDSPFLDERSKLETLYLATLSRMPAEAERQKMSSYINESNDHTAALADVFWALLNSTEFITNH